MHFGEPKPSRQHKVFINEHNILISQPYLGQCKIPRIQVEYPPFYMVIFILYIIQFYAVFLPYKYKVAHQSYKFQGHVQTTNGPVSTETVLRQNGFAMGKSPAVMVQMKLTPMHVVPKVGIHAYLQKMCTCTILHSLY